MFSRMMPKEGKFFNHFQDLTNQIIEGSKTFNEMLRAPQDYELHSKRIKDIEHKADEITHQAIELLHKTFITPMDREDIHSLVSGLDDIMDCIDAASARLFLYKVGQVPEEAIRMAEVNLQAVLKLETAVKQLDNLKNPDAILKICIEIHRLENEADHILRVSIAKLFAEEEDVKRLIKMKEIFELLELVTDRCEDVANTIEGIVVEYA